MDNLSSTSSTGSADKPKSAKRVHLGWKIFAGFVAVSLAIRIPLVCFVLAALSLVIFSIAKERKSWRSMSMKSGVIFGILGAIGVPGMLEERAAEKERARIAEANAKQRAADRAADEARTVAANAVKTKKLLESFNEVIANIDTRALASSSAMMNTTHPRALALIREFDLEVGGWMSLAKAAGRDDLATPLRTSGERGMKSLVDARQEALARQIEEIDRLYESGHFEAARERAFNMRTALDETIADRTMPNAFREWSKQARASVEEKLRLALRGKTFPEAVEYMKNWRAKRVEFTKRVDELGSQAAHQALVVDLARPLFYVKCLKEITPAEYKLVPSQYRAAAFLRSIERDVSALEARANKELVYVVSCGDRPKHSGWDGGNSAAEQLVKRSAHDPDSIDVENCTAPELTMRSCWQFTCDVRGKNMFGAMVLNRRTFYENATTISVR